MPSWLPHLLPTIVTAAVALTGVALGFLGTRWSVTRADKLARERDELQHRRKLLGERYQAQRKAYAAYRRLIETADDPRFGKSAEVAQLLFDAFENSALVNECIDSALLAYKESICCLLLLVYRELRQRF